MPRREPNDNARIARTNRLANLIDELIDQGLTQREIAVNLNVAPNYLSDIKRGHRDHKTP